MTDLFSEPKPLIAMIHVGALPGTPHAASPVSALIDQAVAEARLLAEHGVDAIMLENMHDRPYLNRAVGPEVTAAMTGMLAAVRRALGPTIPLGMQILAGANKEALSAVAAAGGNFIRAEGFVFAHVADEGLMLEADAGELLRYRRRLGANGVRILADIKKKHSSHAITADVDLGATARAAEFFGADALVVTGEETSRPTSPDHLREVKENASLPVLVGSGATADSLPALAPFADGFIVGSALKVDGVWSNPPAPKRVASMVQAVQRLRDS